MLKREKHLKILIAFVIILFVLSGIFINLVPHFHECINTDCAVCAFIVSSRDTTFAAILSISFSLSGLSFAFFYVYSRVFPLSKTTPVRLKVKLSD